MKTFYIVIIAIILIGAGWYFYSGTEVPQEMPNEAAPATNTQNTPAEEGGDADTTADEEMNDMETEGGTDAGMEFPTVDGGLDIEIDSNAKVFNIGGENFEFDVAEIRVEEGDTVVINFTSTGGLHDWTIDEFDANTARVQTGETSSVTFVAERAGSFEYYCSVGQHRANGMVGTLIVE
jgi:plastocyanin